MIVMALGMAMGGLIASVFWIAVLTASDDSTSDNVEEPT